MPHVSFGIRLCCLVVASVTAGVLVNAGWHISATVATAAWFFSVAACSAYPRVCRGLAWCVVGALGFAHGASAVDRPPPLWIFTADEQVSIEGRLVRDASVGEAGVRLELRDVQVTSGPRQAALGGHDVLAIIGGVMAAESVTTWTAGRWVRMPARLRPPQVVRNPGSPGVEWQQLTRPFDVLAAVKSAALVEAMRATAWQEAAAWIRRHVRRVCRQWITPIDAQSGAVVTAILIGDRAGLDEALTRRLQVAGTFHVIAISGGNVAILTALCLFGGRAVVRRERPLLLLTLAIVLAYGLVVGREASVARAVVAAGLYLALRFAGIVPRPLNVLAVTGVLCVLHDPLMPLDVGAWLSFGATFGLIAILPGFTHRQPLVRGSWPAAALRGAVVLMLATAAAELMTLPVTASVFMRVGVAGFPLNLVAIPAMTMAQVAGVGLCVIGFWWPEAATVFAAASHHAVAVLTTSAALVEVAPWLTWRVAPPPIPVVAGYYTALLAAVFWGGRRAVTRTAIVIVVVLAAGIATAPWTSWNAPPKGWLRVTIFDVGQGEAVAVQLPNGHNLLVDAGGSTSGFDVGGRVVTPALWASGVRRLDWVAMTHGDLDHVGGVMRVAEDLAPAEFWEGVPVPGLPLIDELRTLALSAVWRRTFAGHQVESAGASVEVLHPKIPEWERRRVRNDDSMVLRIRFGLVEVLLTGDAGAEFESAFVRDPASPPIRLLKVGHHGSRSSSSEAFLDAYVPTAAIVSAGQGNLFGHPSPVVLHRLHQRNIDVFRTDREGAIVIETDGRVASVRSAAGRRLRVTASRP